MFHLSLAGPSQERNTIINRVLFVVGPALGHVSRSLVIARALRKIADCEIEFAGASPGFGEKIVPGEFVFHSLPFSKPGDLVFADALESLLGAVAPDQICLDMTPIPWLAWVRFPAIETAYITNFFLTHAFSYHTFQQDLFEASKTELNLIRASRKLDPLFDVKTLYDRGKIILCDPPSLIDGNMPLPAHFHLVGPCFWEPEGTVPSELVDSKDPLVVSFGSTGFRPFSRQLADKLARIVAAKKVIWLGGKLSDGNHYSGPIEHHTYPALPASKILSQAKFIVTQGGAGSTYQALSWGKPVGIWPSHRNQEVLGSIVQDAGLGMLLSEEPEVLDSLSFGLDRMMVNGQQFAESLSDIDGPTNAARILLN